ncbi:MAG: oxidoreductase [Spirochaetales bacterium]|nr:oxidoreductase [Spirochaetales bacterium]
MADFKVGIIGCGRPRSVEGSTGFGMAHLHAQGYESSPSAAIVAAADISRQNLEAFKTEHNVPRGYTSTEDMLREENLDIVSICLWPHLHAPMVQLAAESGVRAIHCEKPMAPTFGEAKKMVAVCEANDVVLTFNHQRRFGEPYAKAKELAESGAIGTVERIEAFTSNLFDWGTHWFDMMCYYNNQTPVKWVFGQCDATGGQEIFGVPVEGRGMSVFQWENGVLGMLLTGLDDDEEGRLKSGSCFNRIIGDDGVIEVGVTDGPALRIKGPDTSGKWQPVETNGDLHAGELVKLAVLNLIKSLETGGTPLLSGRNALQATELIFATYESSRLRRRIDLPLHITDSPYITMLENADISP